MDKETFPKEERGKTFAMSSFFNTLFEQFEKKITDEIFCFIQNDKALMKDYLDFVASCGNLQHVNSRIAQEITKRYNLISSERIISDPRSNLIQSYTELKNKSL